LVVVVVVLVVLLVDVGIEHIGIRGNIFPQQDLLV